MSRFFAAALFLLISVSHAAAAERALPPSNVDFDGFMELADVVRPIRAERLVSLPEFITLSHEPGTVILDTRSKEKFDEMHVKGAIHLDFTDFTLSNLRSLIPDPKTRILIYCNNNFDDEPISFPTKVMTPDSGLFPEGNPREHKPLMLALNVPTYINLYGYGYRNIYELKDLVPVDDPRMEFEGERVGAVTAIKIKVR